VLRARAPACRCSKLPVLKAVQLLHILHPHLLQAVAPAALAELEESALAVHMRAMESLDDVVTAFMKIKDVHGCHEAARCDQGPQGSRCNTLALSRCLLCWP
jgi:hypothetical protein